MLVLTLNIDDILKMQKFVSDEYQFEDFADDYKIVVKERYVREDKLISMFNFIKNLC